jgi:hypothetical protein
LADRPQILCLIGACWGAKYKTAKTWAFFELIARRRRFAAKSKVKKASKVLLKNNSLRLASYDSKQPEIGRCRGFRLANFEQPQPPSCNE